VKKAERDAEIVASFEAGFGVEEISSTYGVAAMRAYEIVRRENARRTYRARVDRQERRDFIERIRALVPTWRDLDAFGRSLREDQWLDPRGDVPSIYWEANRVLMQWLEGRANDHMTVLRLRRLTEVPA
jgi:hypothetical protein